MLKDYNQGDQVSLTMLVISATPRETKAKKPYLSLVLTDGEQQIAANYWDWASGKVPPKNAIVDVKAQLTKWNGTPQLNISSILGNENASIAQFVPKSEIDSETILEGVLEHLSASVDSAELSQLGIDIITALRAHWLVTPGAITVHHAYLGGNLVHCFAVGRIAQAIAKEMQEINGEEFVNPDLCFLGGFLHDVGKLFTYKFEGATIEMTDEGKMFDHTFLGARFLSNFIEAVTSGEAPSTNPDAYANIPWDVEGNYPLFQVLIHIILSHHGELEKGAAVPPLCVEAGIVNAADGIDSAAEMVKMFSKTDAMWTDRIFFLNNKPHISTKWLSQW